MVLIEVSPRFFSYEYLDQNKGKYYMGRLSAIMSSANLRQRKGEMLKDLSAWIGEYRKILVENPEDLSSCE